MPFLKFGRAKKPSSYSIHPAITYSLMPFPGCHGRQPLQNLPFFVQYLTISPHIVVTIRHVIDVFVYGNGRPSACCRTHLALRVGHLVVSGGGGGQGGAFCGVRGVARGRTESFGAGLGKGEGRRKVKGFQAPTEYRYRTSSGLECPE